MSDPTQYKKDPATGDFVESPSTLELHEAADGQHYGLGLIPPDEFPVGTPGVDFKVLTKDEIRRELAGKTSMYGHRQLFDLSWNSNQQRTNGCNGHATARALSRSFYLKTRLKLLLSGADAYSQMNGGRDAGSSLANGMKVVQQGIALESTVPWNMIYDRQIPASAKAERLRFRGHEPIACDTEEEAATGLLLGYQLVVAVQVDRAGRYESLDDRGVSRGGNGPGNHAVGVDDLRLADDGTIEFDQYGSWGSHCARVWLRWDQHLKQTVTQHRFWLLRAALEDPQSDSPPPVRE